MSFANAPFYINQHASMALQSMVLPVFERWAGRSFLTIHAVIFHGNLMKPILRSKHETASTLVELIWPVSANGNTKSR